MEAGLAPDSVSTLMSILPVMLADDVGIALLRAAADYHAPPGIAGREAASAISAAVGREVVGILLYGSRARGEATPTSDVDALVFVAGGERGGLRGTSAGTDLDVEIVPVDATEGLDPAAYIHLGGGVPLHDPTGVVGAFLGRVEAHRARGPKALTPDEVIRYQVWTQRMLARIERHLDTDPALGTFQLSWLLTTLMELYFQLRSLWTRSAKESLRHWATEAPELRGLWDEYAAARDPRIQLAVIERLVEATFAGAQQDDRGADFVVN